MPMDAVRVHKVYRLTTFNVDRRLFLSYARYQFLFQRAVPFRYFDYKLYVLFSVLYMRKTPIKQGKNYSTTPTANNFIYFYS